MTPRTPVGRNAEDPTGLHVDVSVRAVPKPGVPRHGWYAVSPSLAIAVGQHSTAAMKATRDTERLKVAPPMLDFGGLRASHHMTYSISTFTIEIDGTATAVLQAKWHSEADEICRGWTQYHWEQLLTNLPGRSWRTSSRARRLIAPGTNSNGRKAIVAPVRLLACLILLDGLLAAVLVDRMDGPMPEDRP